MTDKGPEVKPKFLLLGAVTLSLAVALSGAQQPLVGTWRLERQEINGAETNFEPLTLDFPTGSELTFAFSVPVNKVYFVSMSYTLRLDGSAADVKNGRGEKLGTSQMSPDGPSQYKLVLKGPNRPDSSDKLTISPDGKSLTSEAESIEAGRAVHSWQLFSRY
jgi:hypothetical protein